MESESEVKDEPGERVAWKMREVMGVVGAARVCVRGVGGGRKSRKVESVKTLSDWILSDVVQGVTDVIMRTASSCSA